MHKLFEKTKAAYHPAYILNQVSALLGWDQETHMPQAGIKARSAQKEYIAGLRHQESISPQFEQALSELLACKDLSAEEKAAANLWKRDFDKATKLPKRFVEKWTATCAEAVHAWQIARENNNFKAFCPHLKTIFELSQERAEHFGYKEHPYDALLDEYEPNATAEQIDTLFNELKPFLIELTSSSTSNPTSLPPGPYPIEAQMSYVADLIQEMGLEPHHTRLDMSAHPFCTTLDPTDVRMTTHVTTDTPIPNISAVMHEGGHCLYERGLPIKFAGTPLCDSISLGIHESQSRFWEVIIGQSRPFWEYAYPKLQKTFNQLQNFSLDNFYQTINRVHPSLIRVHADEITYTLHVILRYELEKELLTNTLDPKDLPDAWNAKMQDYLGITPPNDALGCLQDMHWACGNVGYFPTYSLGNLYAAQFFATFIKTYPDYTSRIASGDLRFITAWLKEQIHSHGRLYSAPELCQIVTGSPLSSQPYRQYLTNKYK
ncbi:MAG: carboxypeptidase M32 [Chlamydiia bacterium]|nr:carboxypeptidase M32 [Chlamydiia bacterium]